MYGLPRWSLRLKELKGFAWTTHPICGTHFTYLLAYNRRQGRYDFASVWIFYRISDMFV